jgi:hypothetical protein
MNAGDFAKGRSQSDNVKAVIEDILGHGNENCMLPGQLEAQAAAKTAACSSPKPKSTPSTNSPPKPANPFGKSPISNQVHLSHLICVHLSPSAVKKS